MEIIMVVCAILFISACVVLYIVTPSTPRYYHPRIQPDLGKAFPVHYESPVVSAPPQDSVITPVLSEDEKQGVPKSCNLIIDEDLPSLHIDDPDRLYGIADFSIVADLCAYNYKCYRISESDHWYMTDFSLVEYDQTMTLPNGSVLVCYGSALERKR